MKLNHQNFRRAISPTRPLDSSKTEDRKYYVDLASVRGSKVINRLFRTIAILAPDQSTSQLFTGHIGCGKSTELLRLKYELEEQNFHVVYFECDRQLELGDVDASDVLLAIAGQVSASLEALNVNIIPPYFKKLFSGLKDLLQNSVDIGANVKFSVGVAEITAQSKASPSVRRQIRERLESRTSSIINAINKELLAPAKEQLKLQGKRGLVVIVDNLDRIDNRTAQDKSSQDQPFKVGYLFVERGDQLRNLDCHLVYTVPLILTFSNDAGIVENRFGTKIQTLPMVPVRLPDRSICVEGVALLRQLVMARAFPQATEPQRISLEAIQQIFDTPETLDRLCHASGGHVRNLFRLLLACLQEQDPPFSEELLNSVIRQACNDLTKRVNDDEWEMLKLVQTDKQIEGEIKYLTLVRSLFVFQYEYGDRVWFDIDPVLAQTEKLRTDAD